MELNILERDVMKMLLDGDDPTLNVLREQFCLAELKKRDFSGTGFFSTFLIPSQAPRLTDGKQSFSFGDVGGEISDLKYGAGFLLHVRDGFLHILEGYSYREPWPPVGDHFRLYYMDEGGRNLVTLRRNWL